jgi:hypothetical protein
MKTTIAISCLMFACSSMAPIDDTYDSEFVFDCLDQSMEILPRPDDRVVYITPVVDFDTQLTSPTAVGDVSLTVCTSAACDVPFTDWQRLPGPSSIVWVLSFPQGLSNAVLRFSAPGYVGTDYVLGGPLIGTPSGNLEVHGIGVPLVSLSTYQSLHGQVGTVPDTLKGTFAARIIDCHGKRASGVEVEPVYGEDVSGSVPFALSNNNFASDTKLKTDARGVAGFLNLPAQTFDVQAVASFGEVISSTTVPVRAGVVTLAEIRPGLELWGQ